MVSRYLFLCFEGDRAETEKQYFSFLGKKENQDITKKLLPTTSITIKTFNLENSANYQQIFAAKLTTIPVDSDIKIFFLLDNDCVQVTELFERKKSIFIDLLIDILGHGIKEKNFDYIKLKVNKTFEWFLRHHFDECFKNNKINDVDFIKNKLGEDFKSKNSEYCKKIINLKTVEILKKNLRQSKCEYIKMIRCD